MHNSGDANGFWMLRWLQQRQLCDYTPVDIYTYICIHSGYWGFKSSKYQTCHIHCFFKTAKWNISVFFQIHLDFGCCSFGHAFGLPPSTPLPKAARPPGGAIVPASLTMVLRTMGAIKHTFLEDMIDVCSIGHWLYTESWVIPVV